MHYTGMAAMTGWAHFQWNGPKVAMSIAACFALSFLSIRTYQRGPEPVPWKAASFMVLGIIVLHFGGMAAVAIIEPEAATVTGRYLSTSALVAYVLLGSSLLTGTAMFLALNDRIVDRERAAKVIAHLVYHDSLTGLHNRKALERDLSDELAHAKASGIQVALLCLDLDGFKGVNDHLGHAGGDELLIKVAQRLRDTVEAGEVIARTGGDEFVIVQSRLAQPRSGQQLAADIVERIKTPFEINGHSICIGASVGVALYPDHADAPDDLLRKADMALYQAKSHGRSGALMFDRKFEEHLRLQKGIELALAGAVSRGEFRLLFQPIRLADTGRIVAFETLLRWDRPGHGTVLPDLFIPIAEQQGLINEIGMWVLREACTQAAAWPAPISICVNFSPLQFLSKTLPSDIRRVLRATGLPPTQLEVEVTENVLLAEPCRPASAISSRTDLVVP